MCESHGKCAWKDRKRPDHRGPACPIKEFGLYTLYTMVKTMKGFQEESDTIRSKVLMDCQSRSERTLRLEAGGRNGLKENDGRGNAVELNDCTCD